MNVEKQNFFIHSSTYSFTYAEGCIFLFIEEFLQNLLIRRRAATYDNGCMFNSVWIWLPSVVNSFLFFSLYYGKIYSYNAYWQLCIKIWKMHGNYIFEILPIKRYSSQNCSTIRKKRAMDMESGFWGWIKKAGIV